MFALSWLFKQRSKTKLKLAWLNVFEQVWDAHSTQYKQCCSAGSAERALLAVINLTWYPEWFCKTWVLNETERHTFGNVPCLIVGYFPRGHRAEISWVVNREGTHPRDFHFQCFAWMWSIAESSRVWTLEFQLPTESVDTPVLKWWPRIDLPSSRAYFLTPTESQQLFNVFAHSVR